MCVFFNGLGSIFCFLLSKHFAKSALLRFFPKQVDTSRMSYRTCIKKARTVKETAWFLDRILFCGSWIR